jgi:hypothetical protein
VILQVRPGAGSRRLVLMASQHRAISIGAIVRLVALPVVELLTVAAGSPRIPDQGQIARAPGTDDGAACSDPSGAPKNALYRVNLANGAGGPGQRPIIAVAPAPEAGATGPVPRS